MSLHTGIDLYKRLTMRGFRTLDHLAHLCPEFAKQMDDRVRDGKTQIADGKDGKPLVSGKTVTGFTNTEEAGVGLTRIVPFLVEDMQKANGGNYRKGDDWASFVVTEGKLTTRQNPASFAKAARQLLARL